MTQPGIIPGGRFFGDNPGSTVKTAQNRGALRSERVDTMARMYIDVPPDKMSALLASLPSDTKEAAKTLLFAGDTVKAEKQGAGYFDFLMSSAQHAYQEREQAIDTLTDNTVVYYSGQSAPVFTYSGWLLNTYQDDQNVWFHLLYHDLLRGTQLAQRGLVARLRYDSFLMSGYASGFQTTHQADLNTGVQFGFSFRAKRVQIVTPIVYNPSSGQSFTSTLFTQDTAVDDTTRHGMETAEQPAAPRAVPAATSRQDNADPRAVTATQGVPPRDQQTQVETALVRQGEASEALTPTPELRQTVEAAAAPIIAASGDTRQELVGADAARFQSFDRPVTAPVSVSEPMVQLELEIERQLRAADTRGTAVVSPVNGAVEASGAYADTVARAEVTATPSPNTPAPAPLDSADDVLSDVRNPPPQLLRALAAARDKEAPSALRSRQRPAP